MTAHLYTVSGAVRPAGGCCVLRTRWGSTFPKPHVRQQKRNIRFASVPFPLAAYGAKLILTPAADGIKAAIDLGEQLVKENGWYMPMQFENPANLKAHELSTGPEIIEAFGKEGLDAFVACAGYMEIGRASCRERV